MAVVHVRSSRSGRLTVALSRFTFECDGVLIEGEGVVTVTGGPPPDARQAVLDFLDAVDPAHLEKMALERMGWGDQTLGAEMLRLLRGMADGSVVAHG